MIRPYLVIGEYIPERWNTHVVGRDLCRISREYGLKPLPIGTHRLHKGRWVRPLLHADLMRRTPKYDTADLQWHQDGDMTGAEMDCGLVLWSTNTPTIIKSLDGLVFQPQPYEVIYFRNLQAFHRRPENTPRKRWLFRQRVI